MKFSSTRIALPVAAMVLAASPALAQNAGAGADTGAMQTQKFSEQKIERFAEAVIDVNTVTEDLSAQLNQGGNGEALRQEAQTQMIQAIRDTGLSIEEYNNIASAAQNNPQLAQSIEQQLREQQQ